MNRLGQASAIPYRAHSGKPEYLLITTRRGNWIFPKGIIDPGETPEEAAAKEALEEAGVRGRITGPAIGSYSYEKWGSLCEVSVFLLEVGREEPEWLEGEWRERAWLSYEAARAAISSRKLREMLERAQAVLAAGSP